MTEQTRAWIYRVALVLIALAGIYGLVTEEQAATWVMLVTTLLGVGASGLASANTSTKG